MINQNKIQLKSIKFSESMSEETNAFTANLWFNKKKIAYVKNDGHGGSTFVHSYPGCQDEFNKCLEFCKTLPPVYDFSKECLIDELVDELFESWLESRELKKLERNFKKGICYGTNFSYNIITWKGHTIETILNNPKGKEVLKNKVKELRKKGETILNTNLSSEIMV